MKPGRAVLALVASALLAAACGGGDGGPSEYRELALLAGSTGGSALIDGQGTDARFVRPDAIAADAQAHLLVLDGDIPRAVTPSGVVSTIDAGGHVYTGAFDAALAGDGAYWIADQAGVHRLSGGTDRLAPIPFDPLFARYATPLAADAQGNAYVVDTNECLVFKITPSLAVSKLAGAADDCRTVDGDAGRARFAKITSLTTDRHGSVYLFDVAGDEFAQPPEPVAVNLRKIAGDGSVTTVAGGLRPDGPFFVPSSIAADGRGFVYAIDFRGVLRVDASGNVEVLPLQGSSPFPRKLAADEIGNLYFIADDTAIRVMPSGSDTVRMVAGLPADDSPRDGQGASAVFSSVRSAMLDANGDVLVPTFNIWSPDAGLTIRRVTPQGMATTEFHPVDATIAYAMAFPPSYAYDPARRVYYFGEGSHCISDSTCRPGTAVWRMAADGTLARFATAVNGWLAGPDAAGNVYVADNFALKKITPEGVVSTIRQEIVEQGEGVLTLAIAADASGVLYVLGSDWVLRKVTPQGDVTTVAGVHGQAGLVDGPRGTARLGRPSTPQMAVDADGNVYLGAAAIADASAYFLPSAPGVVRKVSPDGTVTTLAGQIEKSGIVPGPLPARLYAPVSLVATPEAIVIGSGSALLKLVR